ncbi:Thiamine-monophosphate kinase [Ruegeria sp. THAF57]|uniref:AIR synthase related protein n=1 Tax=Ruegeria sp. THAF57 TaxID=2744555 RepID=UPI0015DDAE40|nr:AIR synthase related protein [Ruegeria sp. THAF57]CAD0186819.1 Thiamine-monophosphate kinase [Ruegeria sp. THAF57]
MIQETKSLNDQLGSIVEAVRAYAGVTGKKAINGASRFVKPDDPIHGPGDDGAVVDVDGKHVIGCGEAILPAFYQHDPYGAGIAAVLANVNDVAAMGGVPKGIVNTVVGPKETTDIALQGLQDAAKMYDVPIIGGHLTQNADTYALSAFALGHAERVLSMAHVQPGMALLFVGCLNGHMREDFPFFTSLDTQGPTLARDVRLLAKVAASGAALAAKDVSMAGSLGSLAMLLEYSRCGAQLDMAKHPMPEGVDPARWLISFPTYAFWLATEHDRISECVELFEAHDLACTHVGDTTASPEIVLNHSGSSMTLMDLSKESVTGLWD